MMTQETRDLVKVPGLNTPEAKAIIESLAGIKDNIEHCETLMKLHGEPLGPRQSALRSSPEMPNSGSNISMVREDQSMLARTSRFLRLQWWKSRKATEAASFEDYTSPASLLSQGSQGTSASPPSALQHELSGQALQNAQNQFVEDADVVQRNSKHKSRWLVSDKKAFENAIREIKTLNCFLQDMLIIKFVTAESKNGHGLMYGETRLRDDFTKGQERTKTKLNVLHDLLQTVNGEPESLVRLSIPLWIELNKTINDGLCNLCGNKMERDSTKYMFHARRNLEAPEKLNLIITETRCDGANGRTYENTVPSLEHLYNEMKDISPVTKPPLQLLGKFERKLRHNAIMIYQDVSRFFLQTGNLAQELNDESWRTKDFQLHHAKLARSVVEAFFLLEKTFTSSLPRASDFVKYSAVELTDESGAASDQKEGSVSSLDDEEDIELHKKLSKISMLYVKCGFGTAAIVDTSVLHEAAQSRTPNIMVAVGLILYQIGSWKLLKYSMNAFSLEKARTHALGHLTDVDSYLGSHYARAVSACLRWSENEVNPISTQEMLTRLATSLQKHEMDLQSRF